MLQTGDCTDMRNLISTSKKRLMPLLGASVLLTGGVGASVLFAGGTADAAPELPPTPCASGVACDITGTLILTSGSMTLTAPAAVGWGAGMTGVDQQLADPTAADETYTVDDATGTAPGWHVTASATTFTSGANVLGTAGTIPVPAVPTFATNGSGPITAGATGLMTDTTAPTDACLAGSTCSLPTNTVVTVPADVVAYPVTITAGNTASAAPVSIYNADAGTGLGSIVIGGATTANPIGWWINVPSNTIQGTYLSTVSLELIDGP